MDPSIFLGAQNECPPFKGILERIKSRDNKTSETGVNLFHRAPRYNSINYNRKTDDSRLRFS